MYKGCSSVSSGPSGSAMSVVFLHPPLRISQTSTLISTLCSSGHFSPVWIISDSQHFPKHRTETRCFLDILWLLFRCIFKLDIQQQLEFTPNCSLTMTQTFSCQMQDFPADKLIQSDSIVLYYKWFIFCKIYFFIFILKESPVAVLLKKKKLGKFLRCKRNKTFWIIL